MVIMNDINYSFEYLNDCGFLYDVEGGQIAREYKIFYNFRESLLALI